MGDAYEREHLWALVGKVVQAADDSTCDNLIRTVQERSVSGAGSKVCRDGSMDY